MITIDYLTASRYFKIYDWTNKNNINLSESLFPNQISSKVWLVEQLKKIITNEKPLKIEIVGSWFGWPLVDFLFKNFYIENIELYDKDPIACSVAKMYSRIFNVEDKVKIINTDYWNQKNISTSDIIINCSSEHMKETINEFKNRYNLSSIFIIQSNNLYDEKTHINCCDSVEELITKNDIKHVFYKGEMDFNDLNIKNKYKRYMVIGKL